MIKPELALAARPNGWALKIILALFSVIVALLAGWGATLRAEVGSLRDRDTAQEVSIGKLETKLDSLTQGQSEIKSDLRMALKLLEKP